ncbi:hypothetical protein G7068_16245 [Leucobacter viscericola]|uniref:Hypervirulence associated protein TUDOR domain-containing protein n=1 Tax=Leucobacter viscericola TaxID=2714935 RepID=A0A6G7XIT2_9MICO|nr:hypothetical protein [Leucobacter viscericola]QIK64524.1 hypothetical protein G7068_15875 [Leucobacter viscericola]QIK64598.1 hypothetical protein G7068_16245 [Leucobacter viscericola]
MSNRLEQFKAGDLVRFSKGGKVDWEVSRSTHDGRYGIQKLTLTSGMSDRAMHTTNEHVIHRKDALAQEKGKTNVTQ